MHSLQLDSRIEIQALTVGKGVSGGMKKSWALHLDCWAQRRDQSGNERQASSGGGGQVALARVEFVLRQRDGITEQMRVLHKGQFHDIKHVKPLADYPGWMILTCDTGVNDG